MQFEWIKNLLRAGIVICILLAVGHLLAPYLGLIFIGGVIVGVLTILVFVVIFATKR
jgi:hypothetical protein